jgi:hypothetical protein
MKPILLHLPSQLESGVESKEDDYLLGDIYFGYFSRYLVGDAKYLEKKEAMPN